MAEVLTNTPPHEGDGSVKKSVFRHLRENPYLFGLSAVSLRIDMLGLARADKPYSSLV